MCTGARVCLVIATRKKNRRRRRPRPARPGRWIESPRRWIDRPRPRRLPRENFRSGLLSTADVITGESVFFPFFFLPYSFFSLSLSLSLSRWLMCCCAVTAVIAVGGVTEMRLIHNSLKTVAKFHVPSSRSSFSRTKRGRPRENSKIPIEGKRCGKNAWIAFLSRST